ncbi:MAG TPA: antibiotic biosynthesis monooxygenase, partial [Gammaproteobacteria bacterium]|nr:antibiotic biosynthesis monooxygenase [Gammaproteobacteria bacterium]
MIVVVAALKFETQEARDKAVEVTRDVQLATREEEEGCYDYCFAPDPSIPTRIQVYELWEDSESLAAHFEHPNYAKMVE